MSLYKITVLMLFVLATTAAYREAPVESEEKNEMLSWPSFEDKIENDAYWGRNLVLYKLLRKLQDDNRNNIGDDLDVDQNLSQLPDLKETDEKKWVTALSTNTGKSIKSSSPRPQPKWKSKKGRGIPMLCYFKLCSFRSSV